MNILRLLTRYAPRSIKNAYIRLFGDKKWFLAVNVGRHLADSVTTGEASVEQIKVHHGPPNRFWADPMPISIGGKVWVFFEDYSFPSEKAVISCAQVSADGDLGEVTTAVECPYHLSYPFVFEHQRQLYLIPETWEENRVDLWRCRRFPDDWSLERTLLDDVSMSDPTLHRQDGKFWLFGTVSEVRAGVNNELHIYVADALDGMWRAHPANPVVSDRRRARPAGRLFFRDGHLIRPGQDCSRGYGRAVVFNRVDELNERAYAETLIGRISHSDVPGSRGVHTVNYAAGFEFLDGYRRVRRQRGQNLEGSG